MRTRFDAELESLYVDMIKMGALSEDALSKLAAALGSDDRSMLGAVAEVSRQIDEKEREIEALCLRLLLRRQPVAKDLRTISSAMKMVGDIERIGDNAADIAEIIPFLSVSELPKAIGLDSMIVSVTGMVTDAIDAFVHYDAAKALAVVGSDDIVDNAFDRAKSAITDMIRNGDKNAAEAPDLLMIAKYLERMGDHAASLARWVLTALDATGDWINNPAKVE